MPIYLCHRPNVKNLLRRGGWETTPDANALTLIRDTFVLTKVVLGRIDCPNLHVVASSREAFLAILQYTSILQVQMTDTI